MSTLAERLNEAIGDPPRFRQVDIARACGVRPPSVKDWLTGRSTNIRGENLVAVARLLGVNEAWLAAGKGPKERKNEAQWPFDPEMWERFSQLTENQRKGIEDAIRRQIDAFLGEAPGKSDETSKAA